MLIPNVSILQKVSLQSYCSLATQVKFFFAISHRFPALLGVCSDAGGLPDLLGQSRVRPDKHPRLHSHMLSHWLSLRHGLQGSQYSPQTDSEWKQSAPEPPRLVLCRVGGRVYRGPDELPEQVAGSVQYFPRDSDILRHVYHSDYNGICYSIPRVAEAYKR